MPPEFDKETNLHCNYFRDYDPQTGRYLESDPIGLAAGPNTYIYVGGNPRSRTDPDGLRARGASMPQWWRDFTTPSTDTQHCGSSGECAAGLPPSKSEFRPTEEIEEAQCEMICGWLGPGNIVPGGIAVKKVAAWIGQNGATNIGCKQFCKKKDKNACEN